MNILKYFFILLYITIFFANSVKFSDSVSPSTFCRNPHLKVFIFFSLIFQRYFPRKMTYERQTMFKTTYQIINNLKNILLNYLLKQVFQY